MANRAERVITCSAYMREHVADIYGLEEERISVIPNGIDPSELVPVDDLEALRSRFARPDERLVLLVGRLVYEKGFQLALEALPGLIQRLGNVRFIVAGSGTAEADLRAQASELGLDEHGTFLGWIGDDVLHSLYRIADLTWCRRSTSRSAWWPSRRWRRAAHASSPTRAASGRSSRRTSASDCASTAATPSTWR